MGVHIGLWAAQVFMSIYIAINSRTFYFDGELITTPIPFDVHFILMLMSFNIYQHWLNLYSIGIGIAYINSEHFDPIFWSFFLLVVCCRFVLELFLWHNFCEDVAHNPVYQNTDFNRYKDIQNFYWFVIMRVQLYWICFLIFTTILSVEHMDSELCNVNNILYILSILFSFLVFPVIYQLVLIGDGMFTKCENTTYSPVIISCFVALYCTFWYFYLYLYRDHRRADWERRIAPIIPHIGEAAVAIAVGDADDLEDDAMTVSSVEI